MEKVCYRKEFACARCNKLFIIEKHYQLFCSESCEKITNAVMQGIEDKKYNKSCKECGLTFRSPDGNGTMCMACKKWKMKEGFRKLGEKSSQKPKIKPAKPKKPRGKISYEELIRRFEYKRVFEDSGWAHYIKGRKWDRI